MRRVYVKHRGTEEVTIWENSFIKGVVLYQMTHCAVVQTPSTLELYNVGNYDLMEENDG